MMVKEQVFRRSKREVAEELWVLHGLLNKTPGKSSFGDDNRQAIRVQLHVLSNKLTTQQSARTFYRLKLAVESPDVLPQR